VSERIIFVSGYNFNLRIWYRKWGIDIPQRGMGFKLWYFCKDLWQRRNDLERICQDDV